VALVTAAARAADYWVAPGGNDHSDGSQDHPMATPSGALETIQRRVHPGPAEPARIWLRDGVYPLTRPLRWPLQPGAEVPAVTIGAAPGEHPVLSGGVRITGWHRPWAAVPGIPAAAGGNLWVAEVPTVDGHVLPFRQLWVNDRKAVRARAPNGEALARLVAWDKIQHVATVPATALAGGKDPRGLEMVVDQVWEIAILRVETLRFQGTNALLTFQQPESRLEFQHPWPPVIVTTNYHAPFYLANAIQFLDEPGEWFEDVAAGKLYYWPRAGEDLTRASVMAPALETLLQIEGTPEQPVARVEFQGITFAHTTWLRPAGQGHVPLQAGMFLLDAKKLSPKGTPYHPGLDNVAWIGRPPAAVSVKNAHHLTFEHCTFEHLAAAGVDFQGGTQDDWIQGCRFRDLGGNGIQMGLFSATNVETHTPCPPSAERELCVREHISNNVVSDCGNEDWGCVGIGVGYAREVTIAHNEVFDLPYTGISVGWGWTKQTNALRDNAILANHVHHIGQRLGDLGGIYTLSAQPGTVIAENSIEDLAPSPYVPDPEHWFYLYLDEGSSGITVRDNWCPAEKFLKNANGPGNVWMNNGPQVSEKVKTAAGLEPAYQTLLKQN